MHLRKGSIPQQPQDKVPWGCSALCLVGREERQEQDPLPKAHSLASAAGRALGCVSKDGERKATTRKEKPGMSLLKNTHRFTESQTRELPWQAAVPMCARCSPRQAGLSFAWRWPGEFFSFLIFFFLFQLESHLLEPELSVNHTP